MKSRFLITVVAVAALSLTSTAEADPVGGFGDGGTALQGVLDSHTVGGVSSVNVNTDNKPDSGDSSWQIGAAGGSIATLIVEMANYAGSNTFGIYDTSDPASRVEIFPGVGGPGSQAVVSILADGSVRVNFVDSGIDFAGNNFGFYLDSTVGNNNPDAVFHSNTSLNTDGLDHMVAYQGVGDSFQIPPFAAGPWGSGEWILAFEDLYGGGDRDYTDFVVMIESVSPMPEPASIVLLSLGLGGVGARMARKRRARRLSS